ncbi:hypothetical protein H6P81_005279 [Aristolochia fimbriata]|uniref:Uncharacterized protein n=1 Tax=Aristolochia fimbriata TaxID=158543 RepID=A0AAV7EU08_ARIFI|nr:hypothetical protein H6P81_005279 [Aristolochia fimbriata]
MYAQNVGFNGGAEAHGRFKVDQAFEERTAWECGRRPHGGVHQAEHVRTDAELQGVSWAFSSGRSRGGGRVWVLGWWWWAGNVMGGGGKGEKENVEGDEKGSCGGAL